MTLMSSCFTTKSNQRGHGRHHPGGGEVDLTTNEQRFADLWLHRGPLHARRIDPIDPREDVEQAVGGIDRRCTALASHEVRGLRDSGLLERYQAERRLLIDQENSD